MVIKMGKVCVFFAEGYEEIEALTVVDLLRRAGIETEMVSVTGDCMVTGSHGIAVRMDRIFEEADFCGADMLVLPGGMPGTRNLEAFGPLMELLESFYRDGRAIAAICAAPGILGRRGMLKGKRACAYPEFEDQLEGAVVSDRPAEIAGNMVTGRGMGCAIDFGLAIIEKLLGRAEAEALADKIVYGHYTG
ncbi:MAG: DJ-1/PfpI family protein [Lachnospiraceae bacterium]|nr:DJ-1/PfpI family protein [Lachnospiraceae bacterium]